MSVNKPTTKRGDDDQNSQTIGRYDGEERTVGSVEEMLENFKKTTARAATSTVMMVAFLSGRAAAAHDAVPCEVPRDLTPLFELLHAITQIAFLGGVGLGTLGFTVAGLFLILPGEDNTRRGKLLAKNVMIGTILLLSAQMIVSFLVSQLGGTVCT